MASTGPAGTAGRGTGPGSSDWAGGDAADNPEWQGRARGGRHRRAQPCGACGWPSCTGTCRRRGTGSAPMCSVFARQRPRRPGVSATAQKTGGRDRRQARGARAHGWTRMSPSRLNRRQRLQPASSTSPEWLRLAKGLHETCRSGRSSPSRRRCLSILRGPPSDGAGGPFHRGRSRWRWRRGSFSMVFRCCHLRRFRRPRPTHWQAVQGLGRECRIQHSEPTLTWRMVMAGRCQCIVWLVQIGQGWQC